MSYGAFVVCNCYQNGKTGKPPHKEYVCFNEEGLDLNLPNELRIQNSEICNRMYDEFDEWKSSACDHKNMNLAYEYLANISEMSAFRTVVHEFGGKDRFPVLSRYLPVSNGGILPAEYAQQALNELRLLQNEKTEEEIITLKEKSTGEIMASVNKNAHCLFIFTKKNNCGIDKNGFFITKNIKRRNGYYIIFHSNSFIQRTITDDLYRFIDLSSGDWIESSIKLYSDQGNAYKDYEFTVCAKRSKPGDEYFYIIEPLLRLTNASIQSGNPIHWT